MCLYDPIKDKIIYLKSIKKFAVIMARIFFLGEAGTEIFVRKQRENQS